MLFLHEAKIAARPAATGRPSITARRDRRHLGKRIAADIAMPRPPAIGLQIVPPPLAQMGAKILEGILRVDVYVHDFEAGFRLGWLGAVGLAELTVHGAVLLSGN